MPKNDFPAEAVYVKAVLPKRCTCLRCGNLETLIRSWRQMEKVRYGFDSEKGRQNHLKLYQVKHYLKNKVAQNMGQLQI